MKDNIKFRPFVGASSNRVAVAGTPGSANEETEETKGPRQVIEQAGRDISRGLRDTDLHGTPSNVPGPGPQPEQSPGAEVPPDGVNVKE